MSKKIVLLGIGIGLIILFFVIIYFQPQEYRVEFRIVGPTVRLPNTTTTLPPTLATTLPPTLAPTLPPTLAPTLAPTLVHRLDLPKELQRRNLTVGVELGVQSGLYSVQLLENWPLCTTLYLVDVWKQQKNYFDGANVPQQEQDRKYQETVFRVLKYKSKVKILRMTTTEASKVIPDNSLDFVYVDARHDYCGVMEDLVNYYPKLRVGGIMSGHDYYDTSEVKKLDASQDWAVCANGTRNEGAVKGAVNDFVKNKTTVFVTKEVWPSWWFVKH
jgi:hypothetical protein